MNTGLLDEMEQRALNALDTAYSTIKEGSTSWGDMMWGIGKWG